MLPPVKWFGGKAKKTHLLLPLIPPHRIYVELFGGMAALLFAKQPSPAEVYNDVDGGLVNFFRVLRDPEKFERFLRMVALTPYSREEYCYCRDTWEACADDVERAYRWFVVARMSFSGRFGASWGFDKRPKGGMAQVVHSYLRKIDELPAVHARLMRVLIENLDFRRALQTYDAADAFFYIDPPYVPETRRDGKYRHELSLKDHQDLVRMLLGLKGTAVLSGYAHPVYRPLEEAGWERRDFRVQCHAAGRTRLTGLLGEGGAASQTRVESIWISPRALAAKGRQGYLFEDMGKNDLAWGGGEA